MTLLSEGQDTSVHADSWRACEVEARGRTFDLKWNDMFKEGMVIGNVLFIVCSHFSC